MLKTCGDAVIAALAGHRDILGKVRAVERLPQLEVSALLARYAADAPAYYLLPGSFRVADDNLVITFTLAAVVRNVAGPEQAFAGDGQDLGLDQLLVLALRALHGHRLGECSWNVLSGELVDDPLFDETGLAAAEIRLESSPVPVDADWAIGELSSFTRFHADMDLAPLAGEAEYLSWLHEPPVYTNSRPDAPVDVILQGA